MNVVCALGKDIRASLKIVVFLLTTGLMIPFALAFRRFAPGKRYVVPILYHRLLLRLFGIDVQVSGAISDRCPTLFVANHVSYLDIIVLASLLPAGFVAKSEVARWPLFGYLAYIQNTVFIERRAARAAAQSAEIKTYLDAGNSLIMFPEGTSSSGRDVLPFKSSLFSVIEGNGSVPVTIQPVSVTCTQLNGKPLTNPDRYAWYGDMTLLPHLWQVFRDGRFTVAVGFHPPLATAQAADRKLAAEHARLAVAGGVAASLAAGA